MAALPILHFPDPRLKQIAVPVAQVDDQIRQLVRDMAQTMYDAPGIGLAATQVDHHVRVIVIDLSEDKNELQVFINPQLISVSDDTKVFEEGCLSVPGVYDEVERPDRIMVRALNERGEPFECATDGLLAVCLQHEIDHLNGKVFVQYLSRLKQSRIKTRMLKAEKDGREDAANERSDRPKARRAAV
jgi:peptide deformylase